MRTGVKNWQTLTSFFDDHRTFWFSHIWQVLKLSWCLIFRCVGVIAYVLLSGLSPFLGDTDSQTWENVTLAEPLTFDEEEVQSTLAVSAVLTFHRNSSVTKPLIYAVNLNFQFAVFLFTILQFLECNDHSIFIVITRFNHFILYQITPIERTLQMGDLSRVGRLQDQKFFLVGNNVNGNNFSLYCCQDYNG